MPQDSKKRTEAVSSSVFSKRKELLELKEELKLLRQHIYATVSATITTIG